MNKLLVLIAAFIGFQVSAASAAVDGKAVCEGKEKEREATFTARFIAAADLEDASPIVGAIKAYVGADNAEKWAAAKATMTSQIAAGIVRRVLFFVDGELYSSCRAGRMPLAITPAKKKSGGGIEFGNGQESIASAYLELVGGGVAEEYDESGEGTWCLTRGGEKLFAATLMPNEERDPRVIVQMHRAAYELFRSIPVQLPDSSIYRPHFYVSMVPPMGGLLDTDFRPLSMRFGRLGTLHWYYPGKEAQGISLMLAGRY